MKLPPAKRSAVFGFLVLTALCGAVGTAVYGAFPDDEVYRDFQALRELKEKDPAAYREKILEKRESLKQRFTELRQKDPARLRVFLEKEKQRRPARLRYFREHHPEAFRRFVGRRMERLNQAAERDPERFRQFLADHPRLRGRFDERRRQGVEPRGGPRPRDPEVRERLPARPTLARSRTGTATPPPTRRRRSRA